MYSEFVGRARRMVAVDKAFVVQLFHQRPFANSSIRPSSIRSHHERAVRQVSCLQCVRATPRGVCSGQ